MGTQALRTRCLEAAQLVDQMLPKGVKRIGPIKVEVSFEGDEEMWCARLPYKANWRRHSDEMTGHHAGTADGAVMKLIEMVRFMTENQEKHKLF